MKLHLDKPEDLNVVTAYGEAWVEVNKVRITRSLLVLPDQIVTDWTATAASLSAENIAAIAHFGPELVLLGTGPRQTFPHPSVLRPLMEARIGFEVMDLAAACRTYNILVAEGRRACAALMLA